jgi:hypothetical protein
LFEDEKDVRKTEDPIPSARFNVKMGRDAALELMVTSVIDVAGQVGPVEHARYVIEKKPHAIVIFIDLSRPLKGKGEQVSTDWLRGFCNALETRWRASRKRKSRLRSVILVLNKKDKVSEKKIAACKQELRKILDAELRDARGQMSDEIAIVPCTLVTNPDGTKSVDSLIAHLAKALAR